MEIKERKGKILLLSFTHARRREERGKRGRTLLSSRHKFFMSCEREGDKISSSPLHAQVLARKRRNKESKRGNLFLPHMHARAFRGEDEEDMRRERK